MAETKIIYHIDEEETPYLVKIPIAAENITLLDFKQVLNKPNYKFFFKSMDQDFGWAVGFSLLQRRYVWIACIISNTMIFF